MRCPSAAALCGFLLLMNLCPAPAQDCQLPGRQCFLHSECCGGCCQRNVCVETNDSCSEITDPCEVHYCPQGLQCEIFQPSCEGCSSYPTCTSTN